MQLLDFLFPKRCVGCGRVGQYFCEACKRTIKLIKSNEPICPVCEKLAIDGATHPGCQSRYALDGLTSFFHYDGIIKKAVKTIKYRYIFDLANEFVNLIPNSILSPLTFLPSGDQAILIPIPLHPDRYRFRGFNQAEVLGKIIANKLNLPVKTDLIKRIKKTVPQVEMRDRKKRLANMKDVFSINPNLEISKSLSVLLLDDVFTTGATMRSAANILKRAGVSRVWAVTMAR